MRKITNEASRAEYLAEHKDEVMRETFCRAFCDTCHAYPDQAAVCSEGQTVTYGELLRWSEAVAHKLASQGIREEEVVAIRTGRTIETVAGMIGIWKAGGAYVYLDRAYPKAREESILHECECRIILDPAWWEDIDKENDLPEIDYSKAEGLALIVYTSGSTSKPKGVMLEHKNVVAAMYNFQVFELKKGEHFGVFPGFSFVASVSDLYSTLAAGSVIDIIPSGIRRNIDALVEYYIRHNIKITFLPPHMARKLLNMDLSEIPLRLLLVGSETVRNLGNAPFKVLNVYGASETCSMISHYEITDAISGEVCPVGKLKAGLKGYLVSDDGKLVRRGEEGELWLAGAQVSRGYYKLPEITKTHYIKNPFSDETGYERVFKTNDILRELEDGNYQFVCRKDNVFKIRGFRVENTAIEQAIMECAPVKEVVAKVFMDKGGCNILCGYFTADKKLDVKAIKERMKEKIPYYMVPTCLIQLDAFPLNINSKIDRKAIMPPKELNNHKLLEKLY